LESNFTTMIATKTPVCTLEWGEEMAMRQMSINRPLPGYGTAIERGDLYLIDGSFQSAIGAYGQAFGDPDNDLEARYKCGAAYWLAGQHGAATEYWEAVSRSTPSIWQELSLYQLWYHTLMEQGVPAASRYLKLMPMPEAQSIRFRALLSRSEQAQILAAYDRSQEADPRIAADAALAKKVLGTIAKP
jgi:Flp pilus assembly protein TadD